MKRMAIKDTAEVLGAGDAGTLKHHQGVLFISQVIVSN